MNSRPQMKQKIHPKPYNTNRKAQREAQKEVQKKSESQKEIKLRTRTVQANEPEFEDMIEESIKVLKPIKAPRKKIQKLLSVIDQLEPYDISKDLLNRQAQATYGQLLQYPN